MPRHETPRFTFSEQEPRVEMTFIFRGLCPGFRVEVDPPPAVAQPATEAERELAPQPDGRHLWDKN